MRRQSSNVGKVFFTMSIAALGLVGTQVGAFATVSPQSHGATLKPHSVPSFNVTQILQGASLHHTFVPLDGAAPKTESLSYIDDITQLGDRLFVVFQNGVTATGGASVSGNADSTVVELSPTGHVFGQWDVAGRTDGIVGDPSLNGVITTVNEDSNSSLYVIRPDAATAADQVTHYAYDAGLTHGGGTDSISVVKGQIFISASNPATSSGPAVYSVILQRSALVAQLTPLFFDNDVATVANVGAANFGALTNLALTDPDSTEVVPASSPRFGGDFMLTSQGDQQQIYVSRPGTSHQRLSVLSLSQSVDDTAWATSESGQIYSTDSANNSVDAVTGSFRSGQPFVVATPCNANSAPSVCTAANYLATLNPWTGLVTPVAVGGAPYVPKGALIFVSNGSRDDGGGDLGSGSQPQVNR